MMPARPHVRSIAALFFWIAAIAAPALATVIAIMQFPSGSEIPLHWNSTGQVDRWGSPWEILPLSMIMSGANLLMGIMYLFSDKMYDLGLVHGVSRRSARPFLCGTAVVLVFIMVAILAYWIISAQSALSWL